MDDEQFNPVTDTGLFNLQKGSDGILGHRFNKDSRLLPHDIHSLFYWRILKKTITLLWF
jgi:hypothetical protein